MGAVGYTFGGGVGLLGRHYGYAADHVGGALSRPPAVPNAVGSRGASFVLFAATLSMADNPARDALFAR